MPLPVRYAWGLLWLQGVIWGGLALLPVVGAFYAAEEILATQNVVVGLIVEMLAAAVGAGLSLRLGPVPASSQCPPILRRAGLPGRHQRAT
jgi:hypothetical protein